MKNLNKIDFFRYNGDYKWHLNNNYCLMWCYFFRKCQTTKRHTIRNVLYKIFFRLLSNLKGIEISSHCRIGKGFYIGHPWGITVNAESIIGNNVNIHKGVTIGQENRGKRKGVPTVGNFVWIGINSTIVGNIVIGDDVLISPNSFVNFDIPNHSIVIGNKIISNLHSTKGYINNVV